MRRTFSYAFTLLSIATSLMAGGSDSRQISDSKIIAIEVPEDFTVSSVGPKKCGNDLYLTAYLQGCLDSKFPGSGVIVNVRNGDVILSNLPSDKERASHLQAYVQKFVANSLMTDVTGLNVVREHTENDKEALKQSRHRGMWLPQSTILFPAQVANPRQVSFSGGIRLRDTVAGKVSTPVSFGDQFPLYRWSNVEIGSKKGEMQLEVEGCVFAIFDQREYSSPLINADYYVAVPVTYAYENWAYRARLYHISSHLGDEYLKRKCHEKRLNKSFEAIDLEAAWNITDQIRVYGGPGIIVHSDSEMHLKKPYVQYGMEVRPWRYEWKQLYGTPYLAMHFENWADTDWGIDATFALGYEWGKLNGLGKKIRASIEYHSGYADEGQFSRLRDDYVQFRLSYGF